MKIVIFQSYVSLPGGNNMEFALKQSGISCLDNLVAHCYLLHKRNGKRSSKTVGIPKKGAKWHIRNGSASFSEIAAGKGCITANFGSPVLTASMELDICHDHGAMGCNGYHWITIGYQEPDGCVTWAAFTSMTDIMVPFSRLSWWEQLMSGCGQMFKSLTKPKPYKTNTKSNKTRKHPKFDRLPHFMVMSS